MSYEMEDAVEEMKQAEIEEYLARRRRLRLAASAIALGASSLIGATAALWQSPRGVLALSTDPLKTLPLGLIAWSFVVVAGAILIYLRPADRQRYASESFRHAEEYIDFRLANLRTGAYEEDASLKAEALEVLRKRLEEESFEELRAALRAEAAASHKWRSIDAGFREMRSRLSRESVELAKRGNVNLVLGMATTGVGIVVLWWSVFTAPSGESWMSLVAHFAPRASLAVLIEVFAYFFLRLYRQSLSEIKFFQNELTNVESKWVASMLAIDTGDPRLIGKVIGSLRTVERNFVLKKGESTVEIESHKLTAASDDALLRRVESLARTLGGTQGSHSL